MYVFRRASFLLHFAASLYMYTLSLLILTNYTGNGEGVFMLIMAGYTRMSRDMRFPTMWHVRPAKSQISLCKRTV